MKLTPITPEEERLAQGIYLLLMKKDFMSWENLPSVIKDKYYNIAREVLNRIREDEEV